VQKHEITELAGGERVVSERIAGVRSVALGFWIGAGSRDEPDARAGVSHFIEHLLFKGSSRYSALEIAEIFDELGGELNAATSRETTVVYARVPDDRLETALDVMADMVFRPSFSEVDSEREVVLEEIAMVEDTPHDLVHDIAAEAVFGGHPLGRPVIGRAEVISSVSRRALSAYHRRAYAGERVVLAAAGERTARARRGAAGSAAWTAATSSTCSCRRWTKTGAGSASSSSGSTRTAAWSCPRSSSSGRRTHRPTNLGKSAPAAAATAAGVASASGSKRKRGGGASRQGSSSHLDCPSEK